MQNITKYRTLPTNLHRHLAVDVSNGDDVARRVTAHIHNDAVKGYWPRRVIISL